MPQFICQPRFNNIDLFGHSDTTYYDNSIKYIKSKEKLYLLEMDL